MNVYLAQSVTGQNNESVHSTLEKAQAALQVHLDQVSEVPTKLPRPYITGSVCAYHNMCGMTSILITQVELDAAHG